MERDKTERRRIARLAKKESLALAGKPRNPREILKSKKVVKAAKELAKGPKLTNADRKEKYTKLAHEKEG